MKRCPTCKRLFTETNLSFCTDDGTPLVPAEDSPKETVVDTSASNPAPEGAHPGLGMPPAYQPPSYTPPSHVSRRRVWPWLLGILALLLVAVVGLGIAAALFVPTMLRSVANTNANANENSRAYRPANANTNANANSNSNANESADDVDETNTTGAPTDHEVVLAQLTDLENEWTVANINADKKALDRILADDYVGKTSDGKAQGKAEYLRTIERDNTVQKWDFENLKVSLLGDRATLTGIIRLQANGKEVAFDFVDKFVWRDGRWQAIASEVTPLNAAE